MNFRDFLIENDIPIAPAGHRHGRQNWVQFDCPFCGRNSHKFHMGYSIDDNYINCWACGGHNLISTLIELTGLSVRSIKQALEGLDRVPVKATPKGKLSLPNGIGELQEPHAKYLLSRGFNHKIEKLWHIKGIGIASKLSWRIFIPIMYHSKIVSWTTRSIINKPTNKLRYISARLDQEAIPHKTLLYGEDFARHAIIIQEGITDVWMTGPGAVATFGTGYTSAQLNKMTKYPTRAVCFDNSPEAQKRAKKLCSDLMAFPGQTSNIVLETGDDPANCSLEEIRELRRAIL